MAHTDINFTASWWAWLSAPKVRLSPWEIWVSQFATIDRYKYAGNSVWWQYKLFRYPEVIAQDLTDEQIEKWVRVEMISYHRWKWLSSKINIDSWYKVPSSWVWWVNTLQTIFPNANTRWWLSPVHQNMWWGLLAVDRPNHYKVSSQNEVIPVWQYLHNRMTQVDVKYRDIYWNDKDLVCLCPAQWLRKFRNASWTRFWYSSRYTPYYFAFRYIMKDENWFWFISWPITPIIKLTQEDHPFSFDPIASTNNWSICLKVSWMHNPDIARCMFETKLP